MHSVIVRDPALRRVMLAGLFLFFAAPLLFLNPTYALLGQETVLSIFNITIVILPIAAAALAVALWRSFSKGEILRRVWAAFAVGLWLWTAGNLAWAVDVLFFRPDPPFPAPADVLWVIGYFPIAAGLWLRFISYRMPLGASWKARLLAAYGLAAGLAVVFLLAPVLTRPGSEGLPAQIVTFLYGVGDLVVALCALLIVLVLTGGALSVVWAMMAAGAFMVAAGDLMYAFAVWQGIYIMHPASGINLITFAVNVLYLWAHLLLALGTYAQARLQTVV